MADFDKLEDYFVDALADEGTKVLLTPHLDKLEEVKAVLPAITDSIGFIPVVVPEVTVPEFVTQDIYGNEYTNELFASKDLTVVNIWGTFCGPCVNEMPELGEWSRTLPENVQIIGLVSDIYSVDDASTIETARQIVEATGADFPHLIAYPALAELTNLTPYVPTTIFVDSQGRMIGDPIAGAYVSQYKAFVEDFLNGMEK
jgi:thiol-disulfide isomerase/thioredoxin